MKNLWIFSILFISQISWARSATEFGNGGNATVCKTGLGQIVSTYDTIEAVHRYNLLPRFPGIVSSDCKTQKNGRQVCQTGSDIAEVIIKRLKKLDPQLEANLQLKLKNFWPQAILIYADLTVIDDSGLKFVPEDCVLKQLAVQHPPIVPADSRYFISGNLWNEMMGFDKAALILHEIIYHYALELNPNLRDSQRVRYFNALLISNEVFLMTQERYDAIKLQVFKP